MPRRAAAANDATEYEVHPLFVDDSEHEPLRAPIKTIDVMRLTKAKKFAFLDWCTVADLPDERALLAKFGAGTYHLVGRDVSRSRILRRINVTVGEAADDDEIPTAAPAPATSSGESTLIEMLKLERQREAAREDRDRSERAAEREREAARNESMMKMAMQFAGAQVESVKELARATIAAKTAAQNNTDAKTVLDMVEQAKIDALSQREALREEFQAEAANSKTDFVETAVEAFATKLAEKVVPNGQAS